MLRTLINKLFWPLRMVFEKDFEAPHDIIARHSHGNVKLQTGRYLTVEDCAELKRKNREYAF